MKQVILVKFMESEQYGNKTKEYAYFTDELVEIGQYCIVVVAEVPKVVRVTQNCGLSVTEQNKATKYIAGVINLAGYEEKMKRLNMLNELETRLESLYNKATRMQVYMTLAESDPEIKSLVEQYKALTEQCQTLAITPITTLPNV